MKKLPVILATSLLASSWGVMPVLATEDSIEVVANQVLEPNLVFTVADGVNRLFGFNFDGTEEKLMMNKIWLATYDSEKYSQGMVEKELYRLGADSKPKWATRAMNLTGALIQGDYAQVVVTGFDADNNFLINDPGVLYYAIELQKDEGESYWVRGKLDYRECAYRDSTPHILGACKGRIDESGKYVFETSDGMMHNPSDAYVSWAEELGASLWPQVEAVDSDVRNWSGDANQKTEILALLQRIYNVSEDASNREGIVVKLKEYDAIFRAKTYKYLVDGAIWDFKAELADWDGGGEENRVGYLEEIERFEEEIAAAVKAREYLKSVEGLDDIMDTATSMDELAEASAQCRTMYEEKVAAYDLAHPKPTTPTEPTDPVDPVNPTEPIEPMEPTEPVKPTERVQPTMPSLGGGSWVSNIMQGYGSGENDETDDADEVEDVGGEDDDAENLDAKADDEITTEPNGGVMVAVASVPSAPNLSLGTQDTGATDEDTVVAVTDGEIAKIEPLVMDEASTNNAIVPTLNDSSKQGRGGLWVAIGVVGSAILFGLWWLKRAFGGKKSLKN